MPTVLLINGFRFYFFSNEGNEPCHIHVKKGDGKAKVWLQPSVEFEYTYGFTASEMREIDTIIEDNLATLISKWNEYFSK
jgi:hypothetical protein